MKLKKYPKSFRPFVIILFLILGLIAYKFTANKYSVLDSSFEDENIALSYPSNWESTIIPSDYNNDYTFHNKNYPKDGNNYIKISQRKNISEILEKVNDPIRIDYYVKESKEPLKQKLEDSVYNFNTMQLGSTAGYANYFQTYKMKSKTIVNDQEVDQYTYLLISESLFRGHLEIFWLSFIAIPNDDKITTIIAKSSNLDEINHIISTLKLK